MGDGNDTFVFNDHWIPSNDNPYVFTASPDILQNTTVRFLRSIHNLDWDNEVLNNILLPRDAALVRQIPVCPHSEKDVWCWLVAPRGKYSVKSGYCAHVEGKLAGLEINNSIN